MTTVPKPAEWITPEEYLEAEQNSAIRHEYIDGYRYAVADSSADHNRITGNIGAELLEGLRGKQCEAFMCDLRLRIRERVADTFYYPDVMVVCDPMDNAEFFRESPTAIFEVLSAESERTDRWEKAIAYRQIPTVKVYALVEQDRMAVTIQRQAAKGWDKKTVEGPSALLKLPEIGVEIPLERIYERTAASNTPRS